MQTVFQCPSCKKPSDECECTVTNHSIKIPYVPTVSDVFGSYSVSLNEEQMEELADKISERILDKIVEKILLAEDKDEKGT